MRDTEKIERRSGIQPRRLSIIVISLFIIPPQQAQALIAASRIAELTPVLRRTNDPTALNRMDAGMVTEETFSSMLNDLELVTIPQTPRK